MFIKNCRAAPVEVRHKVPYDHSFYEAMGSSQLPDVMGFDFGRRICCLDEGPNV